MRLIIPKSTHHQLYKQKNPRMWGFCLNPIPLGGGLYQQYHLFGLPDILRQNITLPNDIITSPIE